VPLADPFYPSVPAPVYPNTYPQPPATVPPNIDPWMHYSALPPIPLYGYKFVPVNCAHCFCEYHPAEVYSGVQTEPDHEGCCNCGIHRAISPLSHHTSEHVLDDLRDAGVDADHVEWHHEAFDDD
jgi:hypothetical protein